MVNKLWGVFCVKFCRHNIEYSTDASRNLYTQAWRTRTRVMTLMATQQAPLPLLAAAIAVQAVRRAVWQQRDLHAHSIFTRYACAQFLFAHRTVCACARIDQARGACDRWP